MFTRWAMASEATLTFISPSPRSVSSQRHGGRWPPLPRSEALQREDTAAGQQGSDDLEGRVLGGGADEGDGAVLDVGEDDVLLRLVEAVDFVHEQDGGLRVHALAVAGLGHDAAEVGDAGGDCADRLEGGLGSCGDEAGEGGLAGAGRSPEDERGQTPGGDGAEQDAVLPDDLLLADELVEGAGAHSFGQRRVSLGVNATLTVEKGLTGVSFPACH